MFYFIVRLYTNPKQICRSRWAYLWMYTEFVHDIFLLYFNALFRGEFGLILLVWVGRLSKKSGFVSNKLWEIKRMRGKRDRILSNAKRTKKATSRMPYGIRMSVSLLNLSSGFATENFLHKFETVRGYKSYGCVGFYCTGNSVLYFKYMHEVSRGIYQRDTHRCEGAQIPFHLPNVFPKSQWEMKTWTHWGARPKLIGFAFWKKKQVTLSDNYRVLRNEFKF